MNVFRTIKVKKGRKRVIIKNPTELKLIGKGIQGAVFRVSKDRCVKIYAKKNDRISESRALKAAEYSHIVPKVYQVGYNYIIMEYINGNPLQKFLRSSRSFPEFITKQLLFIFTEMKRIGFTRIDASLRHLIVNDRGVIKVVDHVNSLRKRRDWPVSFFSSLAKLKLLNSFLYQVKKIDPQQYSKWKKSYKAFGKISK